MCSSDLEERIIMRTHVVRSAELVATAAKLRGSVQAMIRHHHENFDGSGYPDGVAGEQIPIGARIIMVADTIDAMTSDRPYRRALGLARVIEELEKYSGSQFDPRLVQVVSKSVVIRRLLDADQPGAADPATGASARTGRPAWAERIAR